MSDDPRQFPSPTRARHRMPWCVRHGRAAALAAGIALTGVIGLWITRPNQPVPAPPAPPVPVRTFPRGIVLHHTATGPWVRGPATRVRDKRTGKVTRQRRYLPVDAKLVDRWHQGRGFKAKADDGKVYHIGYHFLILPDGTIQRGRPETLHGAHARDHNDTIGICLVGCFHGKANPHEALGPLEPSEEQRRSLDGLLRQLLAKYDLSPSDVRLHREVVRTTACPGDHFPTAEIRADLWRDYHPRAATAGHPPGRLAAGG